MTVPPMTPVAFPLNSWLPAVVILRGTDRVVVGQSPPESGCGVVVEVTFGCLAVHKYGDVTARARHAIVVWFSHGYRGRELDRVTEQSYRCARRRILRAISAGHDGRLGSHHLVCCFVERDGGRVVIGIGRGCHERHPPREAPHCRR